ncbi:MAG: DUF1292 domain-containing protein [Firmicutes bacterium]|nr:DUF1292 domain-containing protein [Bacillota bacterium]
MTEEKDKCCQEHEHDCDCGCHEEADYITLQFDDGEDVECEILGLFDYEGAEYIALLPEDGTDDVYIYGYKEISEEEFELIDIEDDELFEKVVAEFEALTAEE